MHKALHSAAGVGMPLETFLSKYLLPFKLDMSEHEDACRLDAEDPSRVEEPALSQAASGSAVQGI